ncbi:MAG: cadherin-like beta sandwich domain-containing protein, partial [Gammaproteobacteria bacterium]
PPSPNRSAGRISNAGSALLCAGLACAVLFFAAFDARAQAVEHSDANITTFGLGVFDASALTTTDLPLSPDFDGDITTYTATAGIDSTTVISSPAPPSGGSITINGADTAILNLDPGANVFTIVSTTADRTKKRTYTLTIYRVPDITALALSSGMLTPAFDKSALAYTAHINATIDNITLTPTFSGSGVTATVGLAGRNGAAVSSGVASGEIESAEGNVIELKVGLADAKATYRITVMQVSLPFASQQADLRLHGGAAVSLILPAADGAPAYTYALSALPAGLSFNAATRAISGRPTATQSTTTITTMTYSAVDSSGLAGEQTFEIRVTAPPVFASPPPAGIVLPRNAVARTTLPALRGGYTPHAYALAGAVPAGLAFNANSRVLSGTPSALDEATLTYTATDAAGADGAASGIVTAEIRIRVLAFDLDVDNNGAINVQDGIMVARYLLGVRGAALLDGQHDGDAAAATRIGGNIQDGVDLASLDLDDDSDVDWRDGILLARYLLGLRDEVLVAGMDGAVAATVEGNVRALLP